MRNLFFHLLPLLVISRMYEPNGDVPSIEKPLGASHIQQSLGDRYQDTMKMVEELTSFFVVERGSLRGKFPNPTNSPTPYKVIITTRSKSVHDYYFGSRPSSGKKRPSQRPSQLQLPGQGRPSNIVNINPPPPRNLPPFIYPPSSLTPIYLVCGGSPVDSEVLLRRARSSPVIDSPRALPFCATSGSFAAQLASLAQCDFATPMHRDSTLGRILECDGLVTGFDGSYLVYGDGKLRKVTWGGGGGGRNEANLKFIEIGERVKRANLVTGDRRVTKSAKLRAKLL